jgi:AraC-like DNA-binding protein
MGVVERGAQRSASGRGEVEAFAGNVITTNPGEVHDGRPLGCESRRWRMVYLEPHVFHSLGDSGHREIAHPVIDDRRLSAALRRLFARLDVWERVGKGKNAEALACEESLSEAYSLLLDRHATGSGMRKDPAAAVRRIRERLADDLTSAPSLEDLARMTGLSRFQVLRRFEAAYGMPPHTWLLQHRTERARSFIRTGQSLAETAALCGFADQSHMTRAFVRRYGFTPGAWRRACNSVQD